MPRASKRRITVLSPQAAEFERWLLAERKGDGHLRYTPQSARAYATTINRALASGDLLDVLRKAATSTMWTVARAAVLAWARYSGDEDLRLRSRDIPDPTIRCRETRPPPADDARRIVSAIQAAMDEPRRSALVLFMKSGLRIGSDFFRMTRRHAELAMTNTEIDILQKGGWKRPWCPLDSERALLRTMLRYPWNLVRDIFDPHPPTADVADHRRDTAAYGRVRKILHAMAERAGIEYIRPHRFRHALAADARASGADIERIRRLLGHRDIGTTSRFYVREDAEKELEQKKRIEKRRGW